MRAGDRPGPFGTGLDRLIFAMLGDDFNQGDNSMRAMARIAMVGAVMAAGAVGPARAQSRGLELNGFGGLYVPTNNKGIQNAVLEARRRGSLLYGGRLTFWTGKAVGLEFTGAFSPARISVVSGAAKFPRSTYLAYGSGKVMFNLTPGSKLIGLGVGGGVAFLHNRKTLVDPAQSSSDFGGVGGVSLRIGVGENVALRGDLEDLFYGGNFGTGKKFTQDILLSVGLALKL